MEQKIPSELELLNEWQERLGLQDWFIVFKTNCKPDEMLTEYDDGCTRYTEQIKEAEIKIINPEYRKEALRPFNFEATLVHELLHMKLCLLEEGEDWDNDLQLRVLHQLIEDLARAFVDAKYTKENSKEKE